MIKKQIKKFIRILKKLFYVLLFGTCYLFALKDLLDPNSY